MREAKKGSSAKLPDTGLQQARCFAIIDIGTHKLSFKGQPTLDKETGKQMTAPKIMVYFELPGFINQPSEAGKGKPYPSRLQQEYIFSAGKKAKLPDVLKSWGPMKKRPEKLTSELIKKFVGLKAMINIQHSENGEYANIGSNGRAINPWMKELGEPAKYNEPIFFDMEAFTWESFYKLPPYSQKLIRESLEFPGILKKMPEPIKADAETAIEDSFEDDGGIVAGDGIDDSAPWDE